MPDETAGTVGSPDRLTVEALRGALEATVARAAERDRLPGVAWGVADRHGLLLSGATGEACLSPALPADGRLVWRIASMTKSVTACCVLILRDDGLLRLDDPVAGHVPSFGASRLPTADSPVVTIRHLLTMSAGLVEDDPWADRQLAMDDVGFAALLGAGIRFDTPPGVRFEYSNLGYAILGQVVRAVSGVPLASFARTRLFAPLGMTATTFDVAGVSPEARAAGYHDDAGVRTPEPILPDGAFGAMGGLGTTIPDFARYVAFHLDAWPPRDDPERGPLARASRREMAQPWRPGPAWPAVTGLALEGYGFGWVVGRHPVLGRMVGHSGGLPGFGSHVELLVDAGVGVMAFANRTYAPARSLVRELVEQLSAAGVLDRTEGRAEQSGAAAPAGAPSVPWSAEGARAPAPLLAAQDWLSDLYRRWDGELAHSLAAENLFRDKSEATRAAELSALRERYGALRTVGPLRGEGARRASWRLGCERGELDAWVWLVPTAEDSVQAYGFEPVGGG